LNSGTASGDDDLSPELFKYAPLVFYEALQHLITSHWRDNNFPVEWTRSVQVPIPKITKPRTTSDYRPITLFTVLYKLLANHLHHLLTLRLPAIPEYQTGFQPVRSTYDHLFVVRRVMDEYSRAGLPVHVLALDLRSAFPSVSMQGLVDVQQEEGVSPFLINRVIGLALTDLTCVLWGRDKTVAVVRGRGVRQGCPVSPWLFTLILHRAVRRAMERLPRFSSQLGNAELFPMLAYADDLLGLASDRRDLDDLLGNLLPEFQWLTLELNLAKCEYLIRQPGQILPQLPAQVNIAGLQIQQVS
jgi:hypothetical protein